MNRISGSWFLLIVLGTICASTAAPQNRQRSGGKLSNQLDRSVKRLTDHVYDLKYRFQPEEVLRYEVVHQVTVETTIDDEQQTNRSHSRATKQWRVLESDANRIVIEHTITTVNMWSESGKDKAVRYNSETDKTVPPEYAAVAALVGKTLARIEADQRGNIEERTDEEADVDFGTGGIFVPLPSEPVKIGHKWSTPGAVRVRLADGNQKVMKTRQLYELEKVESGVATISVKTQVLTPIPDARVQSQLIQKLTNGKIRFDLDQGRVISREWQWDESVVGFSGAASNMKYLGQLTERLVEDAPVATNANKARANTR